MVGRGGAEALPAETSALSATRGSPALDAITIVWGYPPGEGFARRVCFRSLAGCCSPRGPRSAWSTSPNLRWGRVRARCLPNSAGDGKPPGNRPRTCAPPPAPTQSPPREVTGRSLPRRLGRGTPRHVSRVPRRVPVGTRQGTRRGKPQADPTAAQRGTDGRVPVGNRCSTSSVRSVFSMVKICFGFEWIFPLAGRCVVVRLPAKVEGEEPFSVPVGRCGGLLTRRSIVLP